MQHVARIIHTTEESGEIYACVGALFSLKAVITTTSCLVQKLVSNFYGNINHIFSFIGDGQRHQFILKFT